MDPKRYPNVPQEGDGLEARNEKQVADVRKALADVGMEADGAAIEAAVRVATTVEGTVQNLVNGGKTREAGGDAGGVHA